ncbi:hypothetical protein UJ101_02000 [Flavobacteriaceae bacterium UJ101]|nr:hypothetical protein UJ101_02000 [Flavobacteriaceae bacterium UJ101]
MKKLFLIIGLGIVFFLGFLYINKYIEGQKYKVEGQIVIEKVEDYKKRNGFVPSLLLDANIEEKEGIGPYYEKVDSLSYKVYFVTGFDSYFIYNSKTKAWKESP